MPASWPSPTHVYLGRRYACGIVGPASDLVRQSLLAFSPPVVAVGGLEPSVQVWLSDLPKPWSPESTLTFSTGESSSGPWVDVANRELAGIRTENWVTRIFAGALGFDSVYFRPVGNAIAFASEPTPLIELGDVSTDWEAWVDILTIGYPLGADTTCREVRRLPGATSIVVDSKGWRMERYRAYWEDVEPSDPRPADVVALLESALGEYRQADPAVTISGGWDSRLLAGTLMRGGRQAPIDGYTISTDDGFDQDLELAGPVAAELRMRHHVLGQPSDLAVTEHSYRRRVFHESWFHTWLEPLAATLRDDRRFVVDGLAGDVIFKNLFVTSGAITETDPLQRQHHVWEALIAGANLANREIWTEQISEMASAGGRDRFERAVARVADHPAAPTLSVLLTRTVRGIALSPSWLFGPECTMATPFASRPIVEAGLAVPLASKDGGTYYRQLLQEAAPEVARLPSTNDTPRPARKDRVSLTARNLETYGSLISKSPDAVRLLPADLRDMILNPGAIAMDPRRGWWLRVLKGASLLSDWQSRWAHRLRDVGSAPW